MEKQDNETIDYETIIYKIGILVNFICYIIITYISASLCICVFVYILRTTVATALNSSVSTIVALYIGSVNIGKLSFKSSILMIRWVESYKTKQTQYIAPEKSAKHQQKKGNTKNESIWISTQRPISICTSMQWLISVSHHELDILFWQDWVKSSHGFLFKNRERERECLRARTPP